MVPPSTYSPVNNNHTTSPNMVDSSYNRTGSDGVMVEEDPGALETDARSSDTSDHMNLCRWPSPSQLQELVGCVSFCGISFLVHLFNPHERPIPYQFLENSGDYIRNLNNNEEFDGDTVSNTALFLLAILFPLVSQLALSYWRCPRENVHATLCVYLVATGLTALGTESVKLYAGYLRPIFYELCEPDEEYQTCNNSSSDNARKSFPSGHASLSFCGLTLLTLFLHQRFGLGSIREVRSINNNNGEEQQFTIAYKKSPVLYRMISILSLLPMALALFVAASRVHDNKHFPADVVGGAVLGGSVALFAHSLWFEAF